MTQKQKQKRKEKTCREDIWKSGSLYAFSWYPLTQAPGILNPEAQFWNLFQKYLREDLSYSQIIDAGRWLKKDYTYALNAEILDLIPGTI